MSNFLEEAERLRLKLWYVNYRRLDRDARAYGETYPEVWSHQVFDESGQLIAISDIEPDRAYDLLAEDRWLSERQLPLDLFAKKIELRFDEDEEFDTWGCYDVTDDARLALFQELEGRLHALSDSDRDEYHRRIGELPRLPTVEQLFFGG